MRHAISVLSRNYIMQCFNGFYSLTGETCQRGRSEEEETDGETERDWQTNRQTEITK